MNKRKRISLKAWSAEKVAWVRYLKARVLGHDSLPPELAIRCFGEINLLDRGEKGETLRQLTARDLIRFVQVGANDGVTADPVFPLIQKGGNWRGILVEPVPSLFKRLQKNYEGIDGIEFEPLLIGSEPGFRPFFYVDQRAIEEIPDLPRWYEGLGNFDRSYILEMLGKRVDRFIREDSFEVQTINQLLSRHRVKELDLFLVDTEGYDWEIVRQLPLQKICPEVLLVEYMHLTYRDCLKMIRFLLPHYRIRYDSDDLLCVRRDSPLLNPPIR